MHISVRTWQVVFPTIASLSLGCSSDTKDQSGAAGANSAGGSTLLAKGGNQATAGNISGLAGVTTNLGGQGSGVAGFATGAKGGSTQSASGGGPATAAGGSSAAGGTGPSSNVPGGNSGVPSNSAGRSNAGGSTSTIGNTGGVSVGGKAAGVGGKAAGGVSGSGTATGGVSVGGKATGGVSGGGTALGGGNSGGAATGGAGGAAGSDSYLVDGVHGRIDVIANASSTQNVSAFFFDRPMRMDAFAPYEPDRHQVALQAGGCVLLKAASSACNPPCGSTQYCGSGNVCKPSGVFTSAGTISVQGPNNSTSLTPTTTGYPVASLASANISAASSITASAAGSTWASGGFTVSSLGVNGTGIGLPASGTSVTLVDGQDKVIAWTATADGTVQLLLNSGWHGAPPEATLVCEAPASAGQLVIPHAMVEAFPTVGGIGLIQHTSTIALLRRARVTANGRTVELVVTGYRAVIEPVH